MGGWSRMFEASRCFLTELLDGPVPSDARLINLLEKLEPEYEATPATELTDWDGTELKSNFQNIFALIDKRFSHLGYYPDASPGDPMGDKSSLGDARDDLADIAGELQLTIWLLENVSVGEANWHFRFSYEHHWGEHLRCVLIYLRSGKPDLIW